MNTTRGAASRVLFRARLTELASRQPDQPEGESDWAKYLTVLISGYLEQSIKDILLEFTASHNATHLTRYIEETWPESRNMKTSNIREILEKFQHDWGNQFVTWLAENDQYKSEINSLVAGRNDVAHGKEANTTNITLPNTRARLQIAFAVIQFLEGLILAEAEAT